MVTAFYSVVYVLTSLWISYPHGVMLMSACFLFILTLLAFFRAFGRYRLTSNLLLINCLFVAILANSVLTGGTESPVIHWIIIIPVSAVILLGLSRDSMAWLWVSIASFLPMPLASSSGFNFPELYDLRHKALFDSICDIGLLTILFFTAAMFHTNRGALIGQLRQAEQALQETNQQIRLALDVERKATQEHRNFLTMVSHEFRTPLGIISGAASVLSLAPPAEEDRRMETDKVFRAVRRMDHLIEMLTDDDWLDMAAANLHHTRVNLNELAESATANFIDMAPARPVHLVAAEALAVRGDKDLLSVALVNLIGNAGKYSPPKAPIDVVLNRRDDQAVIRVVDHGAGIAPADLPHVFEKYYRSGRVAQTPGTGLGLYLVKRIAERHGGSISVDSAPGQGSTFTLCLPLSG